MPSSVEAGGFEETEAEWEELLGRSPSNTIFLTPWWQRVWWECFGGDSELMLLSLHDGGEPLGIAPLMRQDGVIRFLGGTDLFDYHDFLVPAGRQTAFYPALVEHLSTMDWRAIELTSLRQDSATLDHLPAMAEGRGYAVEVAEEDMAPMVVLPPTWEEYVAGLAKKDRHELRRKLRRLRAAGAVDQHVYDRPDGLREGMPDFLRLLRASSPEKAEFMTAERERFFTRIALELGSRDQLRLAFLVINGVRVASCISLDYLDTYLLYNSGYDPGYSQLSVGILSKALAIKDAIGEGKRYFDFLRGTERYKYSLGAEDRALHRLTIRR